MSVPQTITRPSYTDATVKIAICMVAAAALIAVNFGSGELSSTWPPSTKKSLLKGPRRAQEGGVLTVSSQGVSDSNGNVQIGEINAGSGGGQGNGEAVGISNAFIAGGGGPLGGATAGATSGGNSSAQALLTIASMTNGLGVIESVGRGIGASGGYGVFGPSLAAAITAATPSDMDLPPNTTDTDTEPSSKGGNVEAETETNQMEVPEPVFTFITGLPTGGGGVGFGVGTGSVDVTLMSNNASNPIESASGGGFGTGFGFGVGNGAGQNNGGESAGGRGGGTALGGGALIFEFDNITSGAFSNQGATTSVGASAAYVGFAPVIAANIFDKILSIPAPTPPLAGAGAGAN